MLKLKQNIIKCMNEILKSSVDNKKEDLNKKNSNTSCVYCHEPTNEHIRIIIDGKLKSFYSTSVSLGIFDFVEKQTWNIDSCIDCDIGQNLSLSNESCYDDTVWKFLKICLRLLLSLSEITKTYHQNLKECNHGSPNFFGVNDEMTITGVIELITAFGIIPNLSLGVGLPFKSKTCNFGHATRKSFNPRKLYLILKAIFVILENKTLSSVILFKLCSDLIAALIQLKFTPEKLLDSTSINCQCSEFGRPLCSPKLCVHEVSWCETQLNRLLTQTYQPLIVKELLRLQSCCRSSGNRNCGWFLRALGQFLSHCVLQKDGVVTVIRGILDGCNIDTMSWKQFESVGRIIAHAPSQCTSVEEYYYIVCPQVLDALQTESVNQFERHSKLSQFFLVSVGCIEEMLRLQEQLTTKLIFEPMLHPLMRLTCKASLVTLTKDELWKCLTCVYSLCNCSNICDKLFRILASVAHPLFTLVNIPSVEKSSRLLAQDVIVNLVHKSKATDSVKLLNLFMFWTSEEMRNTSSLETLKSLKTPFNMVDTNASIRLVESSHAADIIVTGEAFQVCNISTEHKVDVIINILKSEKLEYTRGDFFVSLLSQLSAATQRKRKECKTFAETSHRSNELLEIDNVVNKLKYKIELVSLISAMIDSFEHSILKNTIQIVDFLENILNMDSIPDNAEMLTDDGFREETVDLALMLISTLLATDQLTTSDFVILSNLTSSLDKISRCHSNNSSRSMANDLKVFILTRGVTRPDVGASNLNVGATCSEQNDLRSEATYKKAMKDLNDPLLPTRGHALILLTKLLQERNVYAVRDHEKLLDIFQTNLCHDDSYLYLSSIDGLIALVDIQHEKILPLLCRKFAQFPDEASNNNLSSELRMKLCEAIVKSCELCGEMLPKYANLLLSSLMTGVKDEDCFIRASSLSAMGDVCKLLRFSIGAIITEVFSCVSAVLASDESSDVRKAAVQVFELLFKGLGTNIFKMIPDSLRDIYRLLKMVLSSETDDVIKLHADNALNILDDIMKESCSSQSQLVKKIQIIS